MIKIFISYSYDNQEHQNWVEKLASDLDAYEEFHVIFDKYDLSVYQDKNYFMESGIYSSDVLLLIVTPIYCQKANNRYGGVGIETYMATSRHWEELIKDKKSNIIVILRENSQRKIPNFLKGKLYIDFNDDKQYHVKLNELIKKISQQPTCKRPNKSKSIRKVEKQYNLSKIKEILEFNYKKLNLLSSVTNFSGQNKIKYDLWQAKTPTSIYYLILYDNITINQTIEYFLNEESYIPPEITVLRSQSTGYIGKLINKFNRDIRVNELSFSEFMWEYCIHDELKVVSTMYQEQYFIDQKIFKYTFGEKEIKGECLKYIKENFLDNQNSPAILLVLAPGGMGKTTMCNILVNQLNKEKNQIGILIRSEDFKRHENQNFFKSFKIEGLYDLYSVYKRINKDVTKSEFSKELFDLGLLCGNINIIIDGLDELISIFQENFYVKKFLKSLIDLNSQLGQAKIIVTSRENYWKEDNLKEQLSDEIEEIHLLGFDEETWEKYLKERFKNFPERNKYIKRFKKYLKLTKLSEDEIVIPFFVDVLSEFVIDEDNREEVFDRVNFNNRGYHSNDNLIDYLIYVLLNREIVRQGYAINIEKFIAIFKDIAAEFGSTFSIRDLGEIVEYYFGISSEENLNKMRINPLLSQEGDFFTFKYDFLSNYFITLYLIDGIINKSLNKYFIRHFSNLYKGQHQILKDLAQFFQASSDELIKHVKAIVNELLINYGRGDGQFKKIRIEKSISALMYLVQYSRPYSLSKHQRTELIASIYDSKRINQIFIWGDFFPLDLSNMEIWNSTFRNYSNFFRCKFNNTQFFYCLFEGIKPSFAFKNFNKIIFDTTCDLGELSLYIRDYQLNRENKELVKEELKKFFRSFYDRGRFTNKLIEQINFSSKIKKLNKKFLFHLLEDGFVEFDSLGKRYFIASKYQRPVHQFLVNNRITREINKLLKEITD